MLTICWSAKGGSGTTTIAASLALARPPSLLVDLAGDAATVLGVHAADRPGALDWITSDAPADHLADLTVDVAEGTTLIPQRRTSRPPVDGRSGRWEELAGWLADWAATHDGEVVVDSGLGRPHDALAARADRTLLVTRACYLSLMAAQAMRARPTGIVLVDEPGRSLGRREIERSLGAPIVATVAYAPAVARAVDSGLVAARLPRSLRHTLEGVAA